MLQNYKLKKDKIFTIILVENCKMYIIISNSFSIPNVSFVVFMDNFSAFILKLVVIFPFSTLLILIIKAYFMMIIHVALTWYLKFCRSQGSRQSHLNSGTLESIPKSIFRFISPCELLHVGTFKLLKTFSISGTHIGI